MVVRSGKDCDLLSAHSFEKSQIGISRVVYVLEKVQILSLKMHKNIRSDEPKRIFARDLLCLGNPKVEIVTYLVSQLYNAINEPRLPFEEVKRFYDGLKGQRNAKKRFNDEYAIMSGKVYLHSRRSAILHHAGNILKRGSRFFSH